MKRFFLSLILFVCTLLATAVSAAAYLDPSAMTYVIQAIAGVVIAGGAAIVIYWRKIKLFLSKKKKPVPKSQRTEIKKEENV